MPFKIKKDPTKIAICGTGDGWNLLPVFSDHTIYCLNDYVNYKKFKVMPDVLFIMDVLDEKPQVVGGMQNLGEIVKQINDLGCPFVAPYKYEEIPKSEEFPLNECIEKFGIPYFTNTISYMIAYAIMKGAKEIELFGVNQASSSEYFYEKAGVEYWLGVANGMGIKVKINGNKSEVLANKKRFGGNILYGYNSSWDAIKRDEARFGKIAVKKLFVQPLPFNRILNSN